MKRSLSSLTAIFLFASAMQSYGQWNLSVNSPIVIKGMQELSKKNDELKVTTVTQQQLNENLQQQINELKALIKGNAISAIEKAS